MKAENNRDVFMAKELIEYLQGFPEDSSSDHRARLPSREEIRISDRQAGMITDEEEPIMFLDIDSKDPRDVTREEDEDEELVKLITQSGSRMSDEDYRTDFKAGMIREALDMAEKLIDELLKKNEKENPEKAVIWDIGIKELDVFCQKHRYKEKEVTMVTERSMHAFTGAGSWKDLPESERGRRV